RKFRIRTICFYTIVLVSFVVNRKLLFAGSFDSFIVFKGVMDLQVYSVFETDQRCIVFIRYKRQPFEVFLKICIILDSVIAVFDQAKEFGADGIVKSKKQGVY